MPLATIFSSLYTSLCPHRLPNRLPPTDAAHCSHRVNIPWRNVHLYLPNRRVHSYTSIQHTAIHCRLEISASMHAKGIVLFLHSLLSLRMQAWPMRHETCNIHI